MKTTGLTGAPFLPSHYFDGVTRTFSGVRERDREVALKLGLTRFVRCAIKGEWPEWWLRLRDQQVIDSIDHDYVLVSFDEDGHYAKQAGEDVDPVSKGVTVRRRGRATGRRIR